MWKKIVISLILIIFIAVNPVYLLVSGQASNEDVKLQGVIYGYPDFFHWLGVTGVNVVIYKVISDPVENLEIGDTMTVTWAVVQDPIISGIEIGGRIEVTGEYQDTNEIPENWTKLGEHMVSAEAITLVLASPYNQPPVANFGYTPASPVKVDIPIDFRDTSTQGTSNIIGCVWDFGDGSTAQGGHVAHTYTEEGVYTATLTVADGDGRIDSVTRTIIVEKDDDIPGFEFTPFMLSILGLLFLARRKRKHGYK